jgi:hypothetical protein
MAHQTEGLQRKRLTRLTDREVRSLVVQERKKIINDAALRYRMMLKRAARLVNR